MHPNCESQIALRKLRETQIVYYECITNCHYTAVRKYIEERKRFDQEFATFAKISSRVELCKRLSANLPNEIVSTCRTK